MAMLRIGLRASGEPPESSLLALPGVTGACNAWHLAREKTADLAEHDNPLGANLGMVQDRARCLPQADARNTALLTQAKIQR